MEEDAIQAALRARVVIPDEAFDRVYPATDRLRSKLHWTPIDVALQVSELLAGAPGGQILDVGSGVGKMCIVGALTSDSHWSGVERDTDMVRVARRAALKTGVDAQTSFINMDGQRLDWSRFGGIYLFNPFIEAVIHGRSMDLTRREAVFIAEVFAVEQKLASMPVGTRVVTYFGFGGDMPTGFEVVERRPAHGDWLTLWIRKSQLDPAVVAPEQR